MVSIVVKVLLATATIVVAGSQAAKACSSATPSMFDTTWTSTTRKIAGQRIDRHRRAQRAAADADMDQVLHLAQRALMDRLDQHPHAG